MLHGSQREVRIFLVAANPLLREELAHALSAQDGFELVGACAPNDEVVNAIHRSGAYVVLLDDFGPARSDLKILRRLLATTPPVQVILVGMPETEWVFVDSMSAGAVGYVLHDASPDVLISSVRAVMNGEGACPAQMIFSLYKYCCDNGIVFPRFARENKRPAYGANAGLRTLHFSS